MDTAGQEDKTHSFHSGKEPEVPSPPRLPAAVPLLSERGLPGLLSFREPEEA